MTGGKGLGNNRMEAMTATVKFICEKACKGDDWNDCVNLWMMGNVISFFPISLLFPMFL